ncbi:NAD(P)/FAD-dependent oxidoreductase [Macrococcus animalis]|uniref:NAD(P)/FAD-dependent oxidoreductase n=1 Tax=Macrococcus animalis TaxID=3395467 RepID=UPI0039BE91B0
MNNILDITIIGGGPAGLYAAFYAGLRGLKVRIIDQNDTLGGKLNLFPEKIVWDAGGIPPQPAAEIMKNLIQQGTTFNPDVLLNTVVTDIKKESDTHFIVETNQGEYHSKTVIVAVGSGIIKPIKLDIEGADRYEVNNLHYVVPTLKRFKDKRVLISGGGNAAVDWAHDIAPIAQSVHIICRKEDFKGHEETVRQLDDLGVTKITNQTIHALIAEEDEIKQVEIIHNTEDTISTLDVDDVIINHGFHMDCDLLNESTVQFERVDDFYIKGNANTSTNTPGIYAIGDILKHDAKVNLIIGCFHDAATSINQIKMYLDPKAPSYGIVSSHNPIFEEENEKIKKKLFED